MLSFVKGRESDSVHHRSKFHFYSSKIDVDFLLSRLRCTKEDVYSIYGEASEVPPFACRFRRDDKIGDLLCVATEDGDILLYDTSKKNDTALVKAIRAHDNAIFDICWFPDKPCLITASADCTAALWDITSRQPLMVFRNHTGSVKSVDICPTQNAIFATGGRDGTINIWDTRVPGHTGKSPEICIFNAHDDKNVCMVPVDRCTRKRNSHVQNRFLSVTSVVFQDSNTLASAGIVDGVVKIWDLRKTYIAHKYNCAPRHQLTYSKGHGCTSLVFDSSYKKLYACSTKNRIYQFDCHSYNENFAATYDGFRCSTYFVKIALSYDDQYLLCGSNMDNAYIWKTSKPGNPIFELPGHTAEVTSVTWKPYDNTKLVTCGDDYKVCVWKVPNSENLDVSYETVATCAPFKGASEPTNDFQTPTPEKIDRVGETHCTKKQKHNTLKEITHFFSPTNERNQILGQIGEKSNEKHIPSSSSEASPINHSASSSFDSVLSRSKAMNRNNIMQSTPVKRFADDSNKSEMTGCAFSASFSAEGKENEETGSVYNCKMSTKAGQNRRNSFSKTSSSVKSHSCEDSRSQAKSAKKQKTIQGKTLINYFVFDLANNK